VVDTLDPDQQQSPEVIEERKQDPNAETAESIAQRHKDKLTADEFLKKHGLLKENDETKK